VEDNWYALAVAVSGPLFMLADDAFSALESGHCKYNSWDDIVPEMITARDEGLTWTQVGELFGYSGNTVQTMVSRWRKRQREAKLCPN